MKINAPNALRETGGAKNAKRRAGAAEGGNFAGLLDSYSGIGEEPAAAPDAASAVSGIAGVLSIQEVGGEPARRRAAVAYGTSVLDTLEGIRHGLLTGTMPPHQLQNLSTILSRFEQFSADPNLSALLDDIRLRAAVELAKLEVAGR